MDPFVVPFAESLDRAHEDIYQLVEPMTDEAINWRHPSLANTIGILLRHIAGSERYWIVQVVGGRAVGRDREAEFGRERLAKAPLLSDLRAAQAEARGVLAGLTAADLARTVEVPFRGSSRTVPRQWAVMTSLMHTAYHLGQIQLFAKMAGSR
jgi:uncharacterized damage-inducible protein DinB